MPYAYRGARWKRCCRSNFRRTTTRRARGPEVQLALTPLGRSSQMLRLAPDEAGNAALWDRFPRFIGIQGGPAETGRAGANRGRRSGAASRFGNMPVLATQQYGVGQVLYLGTDELWRWRRDDGGKRIPAALGPDRAGSGAGASAGHRRRPSSPSTRRSTTWATP